MANWWYGDVGGYITDDSSFCGKTSLGLLFALLTRLSGDEDLKARYEDLSNGRAERAYYPPVFVPLYKKPKHLEHDNSSRLEPAVNSELMRNHEVLNILTHRPQINRS